MTSFYFAGDPFPYWKGALIAGATVAFIAGLLVFEVKKFNARNKREA